MTNIIENIRTEELYSPLNLETKIIINKLKVGHNNYNYNHIEAKRINSLGNKHMKYNSMKLKEFYKNNIKKSLIKIKKINEIKKGNNNFNKCLRINSTGSFSTVLLNKFSNMKLSHIIKKKIKVKN